MKRLLAAGWLGESGQVIHLRDVNFGTKVECSRDGEFIRTAFNPDKLCQKCVWQLKIHGWFVTRIGEFDIDVEQNVSEDRKKMAWDVKFGRK